MQTFSHTIQMWYDGADLFFYCSDLYRFLRALSEDV